MEKTNDAEKFLMGKTIVKAEVGGYGIKLTFDNNYVFDYDASDGGYSCWEIYKENNNEDISYE